MGISLHLGGEGATLLTALLQRGQEPSGRKDDRFSASRGAEGGVHRPFRRPSGYLCLLYQKTAASQGSALYSSECVEEQFCELRLDKVLGSLHRWIGLARRVP